MSFALRQAFVSDIQDIMNVEAEAFFTPIREKEEVFVERITVFPQGFFVLIDQDTNKVCGYFASERWESYALTSDDFLLDHSARERHKNNGSMCIFLPWEYCKPTGERGWERICLRNLVTHWQKL